MSLNIELCPPTAALFSIDEISTSFFVVKMLQINKCNICTMHRLQDCVERSEKVRVLPFSLFFERFQER